MCMCSDCPVMASFELYLLLFQAKRKLKLLFFVIAVSVLFIKISLDTTNISTSISVKSFSAFDKYTEPPKSPLSSMITSKNVQNRNETHTSKGFSKINTQDGVLKGTNNCVVERQFHPNDDDYNNIVNGLVKVVDLMTEVRNEDYLN